jgi:hypothetical protein
MVRRLSNIEVVAIAIIVLSVLIADFYLPTSPVVQKAEVYRPVIRIYSERKGIEPVIFDTTQVVFAAVTPAPWDSNPPAVRETDDVNASRVRDAFASHRAASAEKGRQPTRKYAARACCFLLESGLNEAAGAACREA